MIKMSVKKIFRICCVAFGMCMVTMLGGCGKGQDTSAHQMETVATKEQTTEQVTTETTMEEEESIPTFSFDKSCDAVEGQNGLYQFRELVEKNCGFVASLKEKMVFAYWDIYDENMDGMAGEVRLDLYNPNSGSVEKTITTESLQSATVVASTDKIAILDRVSKCVYLYDEQLELAQTESLPSNMELELTPVMSEDCRYIAGIGNEAPIYVYVYDLQEHKQIKIDLGGRGGFHICGILNNDIVAILEDNAGIKRHFYSISEGKLVELENMRCFDEEIQSYGDSYFANFKNECKGGLYYGQLQGEHYAIQNDFLYSWPVWFYRGNEVVMAGKDEENNTVQICDYDLENGNTKGIVTVPFQGAPIDLNVTCHYLDYYNLAFVTLFDSEQEKMTCYMVDVNSMKGEETGYQVRKAGESIVKDFGELEPLRKKADELEEKYGIDIYMGEECQNQSGWTYKGDVVTDYATIDEALNQMDRQLQIYPENFFGQLQIEKGEKVAFYLVGPLWDAGEMDDQLTLCGAFTSSASNYSYVAYDISDPLEDYIWHETMHLINIKLEYTDGFDFYAYSEQWESLNPSDFAWTGMEAFENNGYVDYDRYLMDGSVYFVEGYGMTNYEEDSATIMENAICKARPFDKDKKNDNGGEPVWQKLELLCKAIRQTFDTSGWPEVLPWEEPLH